MSRLSLRRAVTLAVAVMAIASSFGSFAASAFGFEFAQVGVDLSGPDGSYSRQAGGHPDLSFNFALPSEDAVVRDGQRRPGPPESVKDVTLALPAGMYANPNAVSTCTFAQLSNVVEGFEECPISSQVGTIVPYLIGSVGSSEGPGKPYVGVFNIQHGPDVPALFGFKYLNSVVLITPTVRAGDYGITSGSFNTPQALGIQSVKLKLWGVPADPSHNAERQTYPSLEINPEFPVSSDGPRIPFLSVPGSCPATPSRFIATGNSWELPGLVEERALTTDEQGVPFLWEGCEKLPFSPRLAVAPSTRETSSPTGLSVKFEVPQNESPNGVAASNVRRVKVTLPQGMGVSPSSAAGLGTCTEGEFGIGSGDAPSCPESSTLGSVAIKSPLVEEELEGSLFLARQRENPFGSLIAVYRAVKGPGFYLKLPGNVVADPQTGQLTVSFDETPQLPFEELRMELRTGPRAPLTMPSACGTYAIKTEVTPWSGTAPVLGESKFTVDQNCQTGRFAPGFKAGTASPTAGSFSPFNLQVTRNDGEANLSQIKATLPPGLLAKLAGVPLCGDAQAASGNGPAGSQVGTTTIGVGSGTNPFYVPEPGKAPTAVYLGGPYKGAPYSLIVKVPAQAGPFDLGTVVVRNALRIDPITTQVTAESDPLPQILEGIPITYRDVRVEINRPEFTVNPTGCSQSAVSGSLVSASNQTTAPRAPFAAANCEALGFKPSLGLRLHGAPTRRGASPALTATIKTQKGNANLAKASVILPATELLEQGHIRTTCTRVQFAANSCPAGSIYGTAKAWTPLLDRPLEGPVYLRSNGGERQLPDLVADLNGSIHVVLVGYVDSVKREGSPRIRTRFVSIPDAPVTKFVLAMRGGKKSLLVNNTNLCKAKPRANVALNGQNGKALETRPLVAVSGCGKGKKKK
jgi:hypothetical protein